MEKDEKALLALLEEKSFAYSPHQPFKLASGRTSPYYIDCKSTFGLQEGKYLVSEVFYRRLKEFQRKNGIATVNAIGGLILGATTISEIVSLRARRDMDSLDTFYVRKEVKDHGVRKLVYGAVKQGSRVVIVDDVVTTGDSTLVAIDGAREAGLEMVGIMVLVDRLEGGHERLAKQGVPYEHIFTMDDVARAHFERIGTTRPLGA